MVYEPNILVIRTETAPYIYFNLIQDSIYTIQVKGETGKTTGRLVQIIDIGGEYNLLIDTSEKFRTDTRFIPLESIKNIKEA